MNYDKLMQKEMEGLLDKPRLLLHSCCAPCSTVSLERLEKHFDIVIFYYNPNIYPTSEFLKRMDEQQRLLNEAPLSYKGQIIAPDYDHDEFLNIIKGYENQPEGGERCGLCFALRLEKTAETAKKLAFDYIGTTLTTGPLKNAEIINKIGMETAERFDLKWLPADFKKREGYKESIRLSREYDLYRQDYCGCEFSMADRNV